MGSKIFGTLARYDQFGNYLMLMLLLAIFLLPMIDHRRRAWLYIGILIIAVALLLSFSRQAWLGAVIGLGAIATLNGNKKQRFLFLMIFLLLAIALIVLLLVGEMPTQSTFGGNAATVTSRILEVFSPVYWQNLNSVGGRMYYLLTVAPKLLQASPWIGFGPGRFGSLVTRLYPTSVYQDLNIPQLFSDNFANDVQWLAMLGQVGLLGLLVFFWMLFRLMKLAYHKFRNSAEKSLDRTKALAFISWSFAVIMISCLGPNLEVRIVTINYWLLAGFLCVNSRPVPKAQQIIEDEKSE